MIIRKIELRDFRNYESLNLQFHNKVNIFLGDNAQGKTNILEAIYISSIGKSFRTREDSEMIRFGSEFAKLSVDANHLRECDSCVCIVFDNKRRISIFGADTRDFQRNGDHFSATRTACTRGFVTMS